MKVLSWLLKVNLIGLLLLALFYIVTGAHLQQLDRTRDLSGVTIDKFDEHFNLPAFSKIEHFSLEEPRLREGNPPRLIQGGVKVTSTIFEKSCSVNHDGNTYSDWSCFSVLPLHRYLWVAAYFLVFSAGYLIHYRRSYLWLPLFLSCILGFARSWQDAPEFLSPIDEVGHLFAAFFLGLFLCNWNSNRKKGPGIGADEVGHDAT